MLRSAGARRLRKTLRRCPAGAKNSPENCLVDLKRDTRTSTQSRRLVRRKGASWSLHWPSGANLLELELIQTQMAQKPMLRAEVGMRVRCANKASAE